ncbi:MAG TPA: (2Fe-2S) ferredoxin domain-containing protein, partial [Natronincola sp.]|nr:(2Fe-2S) ferredoxin domain-containing protein [Natronincola sp.]
MITTLEQIKSIEKGYNEAMKKGKAQILVCAGTGCVAGGSLSVYAALVEELKNRNLFTTINCL